jgi:hypothetical protein
MREDMAAGRPDANACNTGRISQGPRDVDDTHLPLVKALCLPKCDLSDFSFNSFDVERFGISIYVRKREVRFQLKQKLSESH